MRERESDAITQAPKRNLPPSFLPLTLTYIFISVCPCLTSVRPTSPGPKPEYQAGTHTAVRPSIHPSIHPFIHSSHYVLRCGIHIAPSCKQALHGKTSMRYENGNTSASSCRTYLQTTPPHPLKRDRQQNPTPRSRPQRSPLRHRHRWHHPRRHRADCGAAGGGAS